MKKKGAQGRHAAAKKGQAKHGASSSSRKKKYIEIPFGKSKNDSPGTNLESDDAALKSSEKAANASVSAEEKSFNQEAKTEVLDKNAFHADKTEVMEAIDNDIDEASLEETVLLNLDSEKIGNSQETKQFNFLNSSNTASSSLQGDSSQFETPSSEESPAEKKERLKTFGKLGAVIGGLLLVVYVTGGIFFSNFFMPNTTLGDEDLSLKSIADVQQLLEEQAANYELLITGQNFTMAVTADDAGIEFDAETVAHKMHADANPWLWFIEVFKSRNEDHSLAASYNASGLTEQISKAVKSFNEGMEDPQNAKVAYDEEQGQFVVKPEVAGTKLDPEKVIAAADEALLALKPQAELTEEALMQPTVLSTDKRLTQGAASANGMILVNVKYTFEGERAATLDASVVAPCIVFDEDFKPSVSDREFDKWIDSVVSDCSTVGSERTYERADGKVVTVSGGTYGWKIDSKKFKKMAKEAIDNDLNDTLELPCSNTAATYSGQGKRDWGNRYCDIDLSSQHAWFYDNSGNCIWEADIVSGLPRNGSGSLTPTGVYSVTYKTSPSTLKGTNADGSKYETEVKYWMPFVGNLIGLHDATWQSSFGGDRYKTVGSHGCVNLSYNKAKSLYSIIKNGDVVVVHW